MPLPRRIFLAINLPEKIKQELERYQEKWKSLPIRWIPSKNFHITLVFLGYLNNDELFEVSKATKETAFENSPFSVNLTKICYGPLEKKPPRMIWAVGERSSQFTALKTELEERLLNSGKVSFRPEKREFCPHITLGRIRQWEWRRMDPEDIPQIEEEINLVFPVNSIEVMESQLKRGGAEYTILESHSLK